MSVIAIAQKNNIQDQVIGDSGILFEDSIISVSYEKVNCFPNIGFDQEVLILTFINRSPEKIKLSWQPNLYYNGICKTNIWLRYHIKS